LNDIKVCFFLSALVCATGGGMSGESIECLDHTVPTAKGWGVEEKTFNSFPNTADKEPKENYLKNKWDHNTFNSCKQ
jgi:hypothetical protein